MLLALLVEDSDISDGGADEVSRRLRDVLDETVDADEPIDTRESRCASVSPSISIASLCYVGLICVRVTGAVMHVAKPRNRRKNRKTK